MKYGSYTLHKGIVIDSKDPEEKGRIQVRVLPHCSEFKEGDCPWLKPFSGAYFGEELQFSSFEKGALVWCMMDETEHEKYIVAPYHVPLFFDFSVVKSVLDQVPELTVKYEVMEFKKYNDGSVVFHNRETGDHGFVNSGGYYDIIDTDGNRVEKVKTKKTLSDDTIDIEAGGEINIDSSGKITINGHLTIDP